MSDTVKLVIEMPKDDYEFTKGAETARYFPSEYYVDLILNGMPLEDLRGMSGKFENRKEQRKVTETMNALLLPLLSYLDNDTKDIVKQALHLLGKIEIEP